MSSLLTSITIVFFICITLLFIIGYCRFMYTYLSKNRTEKYFIETSKISVIIPYRNEINNLPILINSIKQLNLLPLEFIWINDHSEDHSEKILESLSGNHTLLSLELGREGKKKALQKGIYAAKGIYILTLDADIIIHPNFFEQLNKTPITDLLLIPIRMKAKNWFSFFYELDYYFINSINIASGGYASFISASGASLLFNKAQFMEFDQNRTDQHIASGDDYFLLQYFSKRKKKISMSIAHSLIPTTSTPDNFQSFFNQRLRWIQKTKHESNSASILIGLIGCIYTLYFFYQFISSPTIELLLLKIGLDTLIISPYLIILKRIKQHIYIPLFSCLYPIYFIAIIFTLNRIKPTWKNRRY